MIHLTMITNYDLRKFGSSRLLLSHLTNADYNFFKRMNTSVFLAEAPETGFSTHLPLDFVVERIIECNYQSQMNLSFGSIYIASPFGMTSQLEKLDCPK